MIRFKASDEDWRMIEMLVGGDGNHYSRTIRELRDRVAALEAAKRAEQGGAPEPEPDAPQTLHSAALGHVDSLGRSFNLLPEIIDTLRRAIREPMAEPKPDAEPTHPPYISGHGLVSSEIERTLVDAGWPEPNQAPASDGGLVKEVLDAMGEGIEADVEARAAISAVAKWLHNRGNCGSAAEIVTEVRQWRQALEAQR